LNNNDLEIEKSFIKYVNFIVESTSFSLLLYLEKF